MLKVNYEPISFFGLNKSPDPFALLKHQFCVKCIKRWPNRIFAAENYMMNDKKCQFYFVQVTFPDIVRMLLHLLTDKQWHFCTDV